MSVYKTVYLPNDPDQDALGVVLHPLGGDGFLSPHSVYHIAVSSTGDASGGINQMAVVLDPRFVSLVANVYTTLDYTGVSTAENVNMAVQEDTISKLFAARDVPNTEDAANTTTHSTGWSPAPFLVASSGLTDYPQVRARARNADGLVAVSYFHIYNFARTARERVPIETLTRCLVRGDILH